MTWPGMDMFAQVVVERVVDSLPEGVLLAIGAWLLLLVTGRHNSGTRFAVWLIALVGVVSLPLIVASRTLQHFASSHTHSEFIIPSYWAWAFLAAWMPVSAAALARVAAGLWQIGQILRNSTEISPANLDPQLRRLIEQTKRPVRLLISEKVRVPAALGFTKPAIVLPGWILREFTTAELQPILIHELAHLRRYDGWTNLFQKVVRAFFFFHPAVWWIDARLSQEREMACDDAVLTVTSNPHAYAGSLISLLERSGGRRWTMAQAAVARAREASQRIARILHVGGSVTTRIGATALGLAAALSIVCGGVMLCAPRLLAFAPNAPTSVAQARTPVTDHQIDLRAAGVVPAAFHPMQRHGLEHNTELTRTIASRHHAIRTVALRKPNPAATPILMASFITQVGANQPVAGPILLVVDASPSHGKQQPAMTIQTIRIVEEDSAEPHIQFIHILITTNVTHPESISQI
jgi:beta-lactamase regulating signal transducer with metallopeptidase domain